MSAWVHSYAGDAQKAVSHFEHAFRLSPRDPLDFDVWAGLAIALLQLERDDEAVDAARRSTQRNPNLTTGWRALAAALALKDRPDEAAEARGKFLALEPGFTVSKFESQPSYAAGAVSRYADGLRKAGLPE